MDEPHAFSAFADDRLVASGPLPEMLARTKAWLDRGSRARLLFFDDQTGRQVDFDLSGTLEQILSRVAAGPARPAAS